MIRFEYLVKGLNALSRAHRVNTMAGHLGAAVTAGYFIGEQLIDLDDRVRLGIEGELDRIIQGESVFSPPPSKGISAPQLFEPFPRERPTPDRIHEIAVSLERNMGELRESGHNVIFGAIAIRALTDHPDLATPSVIEGICQLMAGFDNSKPGSGYYGKEKGRIDGRRVRLDASETLPPYKDLTEMAKRVLDELILKGGERRDGFGGLWHLINHAAALAELASYGYRDLATKGLAAHHRHLALFRSLPNVSDELGKETPTEHHPRSPLFWQEGKIRREPSRARIDHRIKTFYGFEALRTLADEQTEKEAEPKLLYLM